MALIRPITDVPSGNRRPLNTTLEKLVESLAKKWESGVGGFQEKLVTGIDRGIRGVGKTIGQTLFPPQTTVGGQWKPITTFPSVATPTLTTTPGLTRAPSPTMMPTTTPTPTVTPMPTVTPTRIPIGNIAGVAISVPSVTPTVTPTPTVKFPGYNPDIQRQVVSQEVQSAIKQAADTYSVPIDLLYDIALQESHFDPARVNNETPEARAINPTGLFQFTDDTWETVKNYANMPETSLKLPNFNRFDPLTNSLAAAYLIKMGQLGKWEASRDVWGPYWPIEELKKMGFYEQSPGW